jgi:hypothetical protein
LSVPRQSGRKPCGIADRDELVGREQHRRVRAFHLAQRVAHSLDGVRALRARDEVNDHLGVARRREDAALSLELAADQRGVREVAVVADRDRAMRVVDRDRLRVAQMAAACGRVAHVTDRALAGQLRERLGGERVLHEPERPVRVERAVMRGDDAGGFLSAVLERVQAEVGEVRCFLAAEDAEDSALVLEAGHVPRSA